MAENNQHSRNAFEALFELVIEKSWCTTEFCSTCGHRDFRLGLKLVANGFHPDESAWEAGLNSNRRDSDYPPIRQMFSSEEQKQLTALINETDFDATYVSFVSLMTTEEEENQASMLSLHQDADEYKKDIETSAAIKLGSILNTASLYTSGIKEFSIYGDLAKEHEANSYYSWLNEDEI